MEFRQGRGVDFGLPWFIILFFSFLSSSHLSSSLYRPFWSFACSPLTGVLFILTSTTIPRVLLARRISLCRFEGDNLSVLRGRPTNPQPARVSVTHATTDLRLARRFCVVLELSPTTEWFEVTGGIWVPPKPARPAILPRGKIPRIRKRVLPTSRGDEICCCQAEDIGFI